MTSKSPCLTCDVHQKKLSKLNPRHGCRTCTARLAYADAVEGLPAAAGYEADAALELAPVKTGYRRGSKQLRVNIDKCPASDWKII